MDPLPPRPRLTLIAYEVAPTGGMARAAFELAKRMLDRGMRVDVVARDCRLPDHPGLRWIRVRVPARPASIGQPLFFLLGGFALRAAEGSVRISEGPIVWNRVDLIRVHFCHRGFSRRATSYQRTHDSLHYRLNALATSVLARLSEWWCFRPGRVKRLVAVSSGVAREVSTHFPAVADRVDVVLNGVDADSFRPDPVAAGRVRRELGIRGRMPLAVFVGGDWKRKGLRFAIEAAAAADWHLIVLGEGDTRSYSRLAQRSGGRVHFVGKVPAPAAYYAAADAFVFPTAYEAFSLVTLEAAATGLPLLVTRVSGAEDIVEDGINGWFIERDSNSIAPRLEALAGEPGLRKRLGEAARATVAPLSWDRVADEFEQLLGSPMGPSSQP